MDFSILISLIDLSKNTNPNRVIFYSIDSYQSSLSKITEILNFLPQFFVWLNVN